MDIQATISLLQKEIKRNATHITWLADQKNDMLFYAKQSQSDSIAWCNYHKVKDHLAKAVHEQVTKKSLYKLMCTIQKQMPNGSISMAQIWEM